ncbi:MAG: MBL fold metallo-hydrolase [Bacteroidia bacterium]|nr:MBL fold metallo-hydrolase [Bacteroidia bacterium]
MEYIIHAYSTALFSSWINIEQLGILFDAGDGLSAGLLQKAHKIKHVFISHPDRDHLGGLLQFNQLNARPGFPVIYYPKDAGSFPALRDFQNKFDPHVQLAKWEAIIDGSEIQIKKQLHVKAIRNEHIACDPGIHKSLGFKVFESRRKLKKEFQGLGEQEIKEIVLKKGREFLTHELKRNVISYSGDTPVDNYEKWDKSEILIHEATFLKPEKDDAIESKGNKHSRIDEVFKMVSEIEVGSLILSHFSSRYSKEQIQASIRQMCKNFQIKIPVYAIYPGQIHRDLLKGEALNA